MKILLCGSGGQLAREFSAYLKEAHLDIEVSTPNEEELDVTRLDDVRGVIKAISPDIVINTAAYHKVDECESNIQRTFDVNAYGASVVSAVACEHNARSVYISTGFVFDGTKKEPYVESDKPNPVNVYGHSKALAEKLIRLVDPSAYIIRTNGLYGVYSGVNTKGGAGNFVDLVVRNAQSGNDMEMVSDQLLTPTYTRDFVEAAVRLLLSNREGGLYHISNSGLTSWYEVASTLYSLLHAKGAVRPISSKVRNALAKRPKNALLVSEKVKEPLPNWQDALKRYMQEKYSLTL